MVTKARQLIHLPKTGVRHPKSRDVLQSEEPPSSFERWVTLPDAEDLAPMMKRYVLLHMAQVTALPSGAKAPI
jgi:hypothetical protein